MLHAAFCIHMLLAIDTATTVTGLALYTAAGPLAECTWESRRNHTAQLLPQLDLLLRHAGATQADLRAIAVALGPGSWSGLRVGVSTAKGIALAAGLPLFGVSTLEALAYQQHGSTAPIIPIIRLGRERYAGAEFRCRTRLERRSPDQNYTLAELAALVHERTLFCGDLDAALREQLTRLTDGRALFPHPAANLRRPAYLAELAWQRFQQGAYDDLTTLEPIYLGEAVKAKS
jgi:tRNA threonylcarbamoyladenosine biosynthesis protein TsaB